MPVIAPGLPWQPRPSTPRPGFKPQPRPAVRPPQRTWSLNPTELVPKGSTITIGTKLLTRLLNVGGLLALIFTPSELGADDELAQEYRKIAARQSPQPSLHAKPGLKPAYSDAERRKYVAARIKYLFQQGLYGPISVPHGVLGPASLFAASGLDALLTEDVPFRGGEFVFRDPSNHKRDRSIYLDEDPGLAFRRALGLVKPPTISTPPVPKPEPKPVRLPRFITRPDLPFETHTPRAPRRQPWQVAPRPPTAPRPKPVPWSPRPFPGPSVPDPSLWPKPPRKWSGSPVGDPELPALPEVPEVPDPEPRPPERPDPELPPTVETLPKPSWEDMPEVIPYEREGRWPEVVLEGSIEAGRPILRVRTRSVGDVPPTREADHKPKRRSGIWALHSFVTNVWGGISDALEIWELMQANMYTRQGTRLSAIRGPLDPKKVMQAWIDGDLQLDEMGFLRDFAINQLQDEVIGRMSSAITQGELSAVGGGKWSLTINQRLNSLRRTTMQLNGGF